MKCEQKKLNGKQCKNPALHSDKYCYWHSKNISEIEKHNNRSAGGRNKIIKVNGNFPNLKLTSIKDISKLNALMVNKVLSDTLDLRIATGIAYLLNLQLKLIETSELEKRLQQIEDKLRENNSE